MTPPPPTSSNIVILRPPPPLKRSDVFYGRPPSSNSQQNETKIGKVITADFLEIDWTEIGFVKAQLDHGKQLLKANHLFNIKEIRQEGKSVQITAYCVPETKIAEVYNLFFILDENRKVIKHECHPCSFGSYACKHKAALAQFINTHRMETQTDNQCEWLKPSNYRLKLYPKGESLEKIENLPEKKCCPKLSFEMNEDTEKDYLANLMKKHGVTKTPLFKIVSQKLPPKTSDSNSNELPSWMKDEIFKETEDKDVPYRVIYLLYK